MSAYSSDVAWRRWGEIEPYYGVFSDDRFRSVNLADNKECFFRSGEAFIRERLEAASQHFHFKPFGRALDFGCGVGRLALALAPYFEEVIGLDISPAMLSEAKSNSISVNSCKYFLSDDELSNAAGLFSFVHSYIVLQHIPVKRGMPIIAHLVSRVASRGIAALHVSLNRSDSPMQRLAYLARRDFPGVSRVANAFKRVRVTEPFMEMNEYKFNKILNLMRSYGFGPAVVDIEMHGRIMTAKIMSQKL